MATFVVVNVPAATNQNIKGFIQGSKWSGTVTYNFPDQASDYPFPANQTTGFAQASVPLQNAVIWALNNQFSAVSNIVFQSFDDNTNVGADMSVGIRNNAPMANYPDGGGYVWYSPDYNSGPVRGTIQWMNVMHEIGHAVGLKHSHEASYDHDGNPLTANLVWPNGAINDNVNSHEFSLMSYFAYIDKPDSENSQPQANSFAQTLMMWDIQALQFLYGANYNYRNGNNAYSWSPTTGEMFVVTNGGSPVGQGAPSGNKIFMTIWDGGGDDTYDFSNYTTNLPIDLAPGGHSITSSAQLAQLHSTDASGFRTARGNIFNALLWENNTASLIEHAKGGSGHDAILGNQAANHLFGNSGNDGIAGFGGNDQLRGGVNNDTLLGGDGEDFIDGEGDNDHLYGGDDNDVIHGGGGANDDDILEGEGGNDKLDGGVGDDTLYGGSALSSPGTDILVGGAGNDTYHLFSDDEFGNTINWDRNAEVANGGTDTVVVYSGGFFSLPNFFENVTLATGGFMVTGNAANNSLTGNASANFLDGGAGDDFLDGGTGEDDMSGGTHNDNFVVDHALDDVFENANEGNDTVRTSVSYLLQVGVSVETLRALTLTSTTPIILTGNELVNIITGNDGTNTLDGAFGADTMTGRNGNDTYFVDNTADKVFEDNGLGNDTVRANASFTLAAGQSIETLKVNNGSTTSAFNLTGNEFNNAIDGNNGNNILNGGVGVDTLTGFSGNDTYYVDRATDVVHEFADQGTDILRTGVSFTLGDSQSIETLQTLSVSSTTVINLTGNNSNNTIVGNDAANILNGDAGADTMHGNFGDDIFHVDNVNDNVIEIAGRGNDTVRAGVSYTFDAGTSVEILRTTSNGGTAAIKLTGNELANSLVGNNGINTLDGGKGVDTMAGSLGNDTYFVDKAADKIDELANQGTDNVRASVSYVLGAGEFVETLQTLSASSKTVINLTGNAFVNTIIGNDANNVLDGGAGADSMTGNFGNDTFRVDNAADKVDDDAGRGQDTVFASTSYKLQAGAEVEFLRTAGTPTGAFTLTGNEFANTVVGNDGSNVINGGDGADTLTGDAGKDFFRFDTTLDPTTTNPATNTNKDRITDFVASADTIQLDNAIFKALAAPGALAATAFRVGTQALDTNDRIIYNDVTGALIYDSNGSVANGATQFATLSTKPTITAADFIVV